MDPLLILKELGLGLATNVVYDFLKSLVEKPASRQQVVNEIQNRINLYGVSANAETIINALVQNGSLTINKSNLHADQGIVFGSGSLQGKAVFGNNSAMTTKKTAITAGSGAFIEMSGNAHIVHNSDGSISFHVGSEEEKIK